MKSQRRMNNTFSFLILITIIFSSCSSDSLDRCRDLNFLINDISMRSPVCDGYLGKPSIRDAGYYIMFDENDNLQVALESNSSFESLNDVELRVDDETKVGNTIGRLEIGMHKISVCKGLVCVDKYVYVEKRPKKEIYKPVDESIQKPVSNEIKPLNREIVKQASEPNIDPPNDGNVYAWRNGSWVQIQRNKPKPKPIVLKPKPPLGKTPEVVIDQDKDEIQDKEEISPIVEEKELVLLSRGNIASAKLSNCNEAEEVTGPFSLVLSPKTDISLQNLKVMSVSKWLASIRIVSQDGSYFQSVGNVRVNPTRNGCEINLSQFDRLKKGKIYTLTMAGIENPTLLDLTSCKSSNYENSSVKMSKASFFSNLNYLY